MGPARTAGTTPKIADFVAPKEWTPAMGTPKGIDSFDNPHHDWSDNPKQVQVVAGI